MLSAYGKSEWLTILAIGLMLTVTSLLMVESWILALVFVATTVALVSFFRDPRRHVPSQRGVMVSPADGRVSSIHEIEFYEPFGEAAYCIRIFLSLFNVHVNRSPCHGCVDSCKHEAGRHLNALNTKSAQVNEWNLIVLRHPTSGHPVAAVRQIAGILARTIVCGVEPGQIVQRGQRIGMIKFGSTTELYIPHSAGPRISVQEGQNVRGGQTVIAEFTPSVPGPRPVGTYHEKTASNEGDHRFVDQDSDASGP